MNVKDLLPLLIDLSDDDLEDVFERELAGKHRPTVLRYIDGLLTGPEAGEAATPTPAPASPLPPPASATGETARRYCTHCGVVGQPDEAFCRACGASATSAPQAPAPAPAPVQTVAARGGLSKGQLAGFLALAAGGAFILGAFLPWAKVSAPLVGTITGSGFDMGDGWLFVALGVVCALVGIGLLSTRGGDCGSS